MDLADFRFVRLHENYSILPFNCGDDDLNDFLFNDSKKYLQELIAVTQIIESPTKTTAAFFSLLNDKISVVDVDNSKTWDKLFRDIMPDGKRFRSYPSVKLGRLGVNEDYKGMGLGTTILDYIKQNFITNNKTGCKYLTVDAYSASLGFYEKNGFDYLTTRDIKSKARAMYFDLSTL